MDYSLLIGIHTITNEEREEAKSIFSSSHKRPGSDDTALTTNKCVKGCYLINLNSRSIYDRGGLLARTTASSGPVVIVFVSIIGMISVSTTSFNTRRQSHSIHLQEGDG